jgi:Protein of unknown function (DUF3768)
MTQTSQMTTAELNDRFRQHNLGFGQVRITPMVEMMSIASLAPKAIEHREDLLAMVRSFNDFNEENDPYGEHDFGAVEFEDKKYFWKIDYFADSSYEYGTEDPGSPSTRRVLTVMHSSEY